MINIIKYISDRGHTQKITPGPEKVLTNAKTSSDFEKKSEYWILIPDSKFYKKSPNFIKFRWVPKKSKYAKGGGGTHPPLQSDKG